MPWWMTALGMFGTGVVTLLGSWLVYRGNQGVAKIEARAAPYEALAARISILEVQVGELRDQVESLEDAQRHDRHWIRCALRLMERWVPVEDRLAPPKWFTE